MYPPKFPTEYQILYSLEEWKPGRYLLWQSLQKNQEDINQKNQKQRKGSGIGISVTMHNTDTYLKYKNYRGEIRQLIWNQFWIAQKKSSVELLTELVKV